MKDVEGKELKVGDKVIATNGGRYHTLYIWRISGFTPKGCRLVQGTNKYIGNRLCMSGSDLYKIEE